MSAIKEIVESDDDFQDALSDPPSDGCRNNKELQNDKVVEEILRKQEELSLTDDSDKEKDKEVGPVDENVEGEIPELLEEEHLEEELKEKEKTMSEEDFEKNKEESRTLKLQGNELFKNDDAERSVEIYTEALKICPTMYPKERAILYGNRAAAKIKLDLQKSAIADCTKAIELWPEYVRAILRRAKLYEQEDKLDDALEDYKKVIALEPGQREAGEAVVRLPPIISERNEQMKEEMMSKLKDLGNMILKPFGLSTSNFQMQQDPSTGSYSINFNQK